MRAAAAAALIKVISNFRCLRLTDFLVCVSLSFLCDSFRQTIAAGALYKCGKSIHLLESAVWGKL